MLKDIVEARPLDGYQLYLRFEDGKEGVVDVSELVQFSGVFEPLKERARFVEVQINEDIGTIYWPGGADLDPDVLYAAVSGTPIPSYHSLRYRE